MKHIIKFSGGKDSLATLLWAKDNLTEFDIVFCDTGWEHELTYQHIKDVEKQIGIPIQVIKSKKYDGFLDMSNKKGRFPSTMLRFCTEELKVKPSIDLVLSLAEDVTIYQGVRAEESVARRSMNAKDEYFKFYFEPYATDKKGKPKYHSYRKKDVLAWCEHYSADLVRPIHKWTGAQVIDFILSKGYKPNPLYYQGMKRVGCFPCIMCSHGEMKSIVENFPETIEKLKGAEESMKDNRTFFPPKYIPNAFCSKPTPKGPVPTIEDVIKYVSDNPNQTEMFARPSCMSYYNICE